jgi:hypothetical protein
MRAHDNGIPRGWRQYRNAEHVPDRIDAQTKTAACDLAHKKIACGFIDRRRCETAYAAVAGRADRRKGRNKVVQFPH